MIRDQRGVVSILTTSFFSILIMVITVGTLVVQTKELRQSTDSDQSIRAYYAAQSGMEEALLKLKASSGAFRTTGPECRDGNLNLDDLDLGGVESGLEITCLRVAANTVSGTNFLPQEEATQFNLGDQPDLDEMTFRWGRDAFTEGGDYTGDPARLPAIPAGSWTIPALMEITVYSYPKTGITPGSIQARTIFLRPSSSGSREAKLNVNDRVQPIKCDEPDFRCRAEIDGFTKFSSSGVEMRHVVRFRPRYNSTTYSVTFRNSSGGSLSASSGGVKVDVTARAGDIFRRVVAVADGPGEPLKYGLDYVIMAQLDICKDMRVVTSTGRLTTGSLTGTGPTCKDEEDEDPPPGLDD